MPHASGGRFGGDVEVFGRSTRSHHPRELADVVGFVAQDPESQFVVDHVERDLAFVLENLGFSQEAMRRRVEEVLDALGIAHLRDRDPATLSGGERQRCVIAGALAAGPQALVLDEPTSQLDPQGADDVLAALVRLNHDLGTTVVLAEHRLERAAPLADRAVLVDGGGSGGPTRSARCSATTRAHRPSPGSDGARVDTAAVDRARRPRLGGADSRVDLPTPAPAPDPRRARRWFDARDLRVVLGGHPAVRRVDLELHAGDVIALFGRNGAGKTTLLRALADLVPPTAGAVDRRVRVAYVPQNPNTMLFSATVRRELEETQRLLGRLDTEAVEHWLDALHLTDLAGEHPRSLSGGERQRVAIAAVAVGGAPVLLLDEPTRGMDAPSRAALEHAVHRHAAERRCRGAGDARRRAGRAHRHPRHRARRRRDRRRRRRPRGARGLAVRAAGAARAAAVPHRGGSRTGVGPP